MIDDPTRCPLCGSAGVPGPEAKNNPEPAPVWPYNPRSCSPLQDVAPYPWPVTVRGPQLWYRASCSLDRRHSDWLVGTEDWLRMAAAAPAAPAIAAAPAPPREPVDQAEVRFPSPRHGTLIT